jgi:hypothetical protein
MVTPEILTVIVAIVPVEAMLNTREALFALMTVRLAPLPVIVRFLSAIASSPPLSWMASPFNVGLNMMVSLLAAMAMALRKEQAPGHVIPPASLVVLTTQFAAAAMPGARHAASHTTAAKARRARDGARES